jgi:cellulose synthase (UDP-forming)
MLGVLALGFYYSWWFQEGRLTSPWLVLGFVVAILYGGIQILGTWIIYLATHHRSAKLFAPVKELTIDVFIVVCGEEASLVEKTLTATCAMRGEHRTWLLDDGRDPNLMQMAQRLGVGYLTRENRTGNKPGNVNAALARTDGDIIVIFDIDHTPKPDFLERTVGYFADPAVGFVQVMLSFSNSNESWVAEGATEASLDFYNPTSLGMEGIGSATKMGSNALIRRTALDSLGGYQYGLADDLATSIALHAAGWQSVYVAEPLAPGLIPADLVSCFTQQLKWARGVFEIQLTTFLRLFSRLTAGQRLAYAIRTTYYWAGPAICAHLLITIAVLFGDNQAVQSDFQQYLLHVSPFGLISVFIRQLALRRWRHQSVSTSLLGKAVFLVYGTWPIYTLAWIMAVLRVPLRFRLTPKEKTGALKPIWLLPQMLVLALLISGLVLTVLVNTKPISILLLGWTATHIILHMIIVWQWLQSYRNTKGTKQGVSGITNLAHEVPGQNGLISSSNSSSIWDYFDRL